MSLVGGTILYLRPNVNSGVPLELSGSEYAGGKIFNRGRFSRSRWPPGTISGATCCEGSEPRKRMFALQRQFQLTEQLAKLGIRFRRNSSTSSTIPIMALPPTA